MVIGLEHLVEVSGSDFVDEQNLRFQIGTKAGMPSGGEFMNPDLQGRISIIDIEAWSREISKQIGLSYLSMENEYDVQRLMYPLFRSVFADARMEETEDSGHYTIRKDIVIDSYDIVIELKCSGKSMTKRRISEEIASDMVHYGNRFLFFYIFDKENVTKNAVDFQNTYERKKINNKEIYLHIWQSNTI